MRLHRRIGAGAGVIALTMVAAACGSTASGDSGDSATNDSLQVLQLPNQVYDLLVKVGQDEGFFEERGVTITTADYPTSLEASQAMKATKSDVVQLTSGSLVSSWQAGAGLQYFCGTEPIIPNEIMAAPGTELPSMANGATWQEVLRSLAGKKVAFPTPEGTGWWKLWVAAMKEAGVDEKDVITINTGTATNAIQPLLDKGDVDAAMVSSTGTQFLKESGKAVTLMPFAEGPSVYKDLYAAAYAAPASAIAERPEVFAAFCDGIGDALAYVQDPANLNGSAQTLAELQGLSPDVARSAVSEVFPLFITDLPDARMQATIDTYVREGVVAETPLPTVEDLVADSARN
ncbi:ABC transporter substrate-binding protein [Rhodococcus rhodochrous]|uniref:ABC transporter substrate-binding protein n=1 Tax=Rhodococcus rhodochrous TaxID=1829 RepID=UPI001E40467F|nr:ABC transporter substrate-binding protein [Rhodococcus rhodochrous]MCB8913430.1 ABC transporter substrate-binding protein [Rhodococcus rhodochrous]